MALIVTGTAVDTIMVSNDEGWCFDVTASGTMINIVGSEHEVEVTLVGTTAHIQWLPNVPSSFIVAGSQRGIQDLIMPRNSGMPTGTTIQPWYEDNYVAGAVPQFFQDVGVHDEYMFYLTTGGEVAKVLLSGTASDVVSSVFVPDLFQAKFCVVDENTVYVMSNTDNFTNRLRLDKVDFVGETFTNILNYDLTESYNSIDRTVQVIPWLTKIYCGGKHYLICPVVYDSDSFVEGSLVRLFLYDLNAETLVSTIFYYPGGTGFEAQVLQSPYISRPSFYQGRVIFTAIPFDLDADFNAWEQPLPTFIFDIEDDSVSKATNFTLPNSDDVGLWNIYNTGLDRQTGTYYIYMNGVSGDPFNPAKLLKMPANASSYGTEFNRAAAAGRVIETPSTAYLAIDIATGYQIYDLPSPTLLTTTDGVNGSTARTWVFGDDNLDVIWQLNDAENELVGFSLTGGADITIELDWTPYTQPDDREIAPIMIHRGMYIVSVLSYNNSTFASQNELVVLGV